MQQYPSWRWLGEAAYEKLKQQRAQSVEGIFACSSKRWDQVLGFAAWVQVLVSDVDTGQPIARLSQCSQ
jgi:hypothetical protein